VLGVVFLLRNLGIVAAGGNWWAIFILIPAIAAAGSAITGYRNAGNRLTPAVRGSITAALALTTVALIFLFELDWGVVWPLFVIIAGISALLNWSAISGKDRGSRY
jgi:hypothetical protein